MSEDTSAFSPPLELWQTEWCPSSRRVRQRLTELELAFSAHQVPAEREQRDELETVSGQRTIPVLTDGGRVLCGEQAILAYLDESFAEPSGAEAHRRKAVSAKCKEMEESCRQLAATTH
jgi:glutaredoxin 3